jgi:hypothetical protein
LAPFKIHKGQSKNSFIYEEENKHGTKRNLAIPNSLLEPFCFFLKICEKEGKCRVNRLVTEPLVSQSPLSHSSKPVQNEEDTLLQSWGDKNCFKKMDHTLMATHDGLFSHLKPNTNLGTNEGYLFPYRIG